MDGAFKRHAMHGALILILRVQSPYGDQTGWRVRIGMYYRDLWHDARYTVHLRQEFDLASEWLNDLHVCIAAVLDGH